VKEEAKGAIEDNTSAAVTTFLLRGVNGLGMQLLAMFLYEAVTRPGSSLTYECHQHLLPRIMSSADRAMARPTTTKMRVKMKQDSPREDGAAKTAALTGASMGGTRQLQIEEALKGFSGGIMGYMGISLS
jgi:hypothetical protein